jgi:16S rRNA (cytosine967-C5)-methyltransferase
VIHITQASDIAELATLQRRLLERAWSWLNPGGTLVYCVCSLEAEEGENQAEAFLSAQADAKILPPTAAMEIPAACITPEGYVRTLPCHMATLGGMDGFFAACFEKRAD